MTTGIHEISWYVDQLESLRESYRELRTMQNAMDRMDHIMYEPPERIKQLQWFHSWRSTQPHKAILGGTTALSTLLDNLHVEPPTVLKAVERMYGVADPSSGYAKVVAGEWEKALQWQLMLALQRKQTTKPDIARSAIKYGEIVGNLIHLPTQIKAINAVGGNSARQKAALQYGQFALAMRNPKTVYTRYSEYMCEMVCSVVQKQAQQIVDFWGDRAGDLQDSITAGHTEPDEAFIEVDWTDRYSRTVLLFKGDTDDRVQGDPTYVILEPQEPEYPFMSWLSVVGGSETESEEQYRRQPLLMAVYLSEQWITQNMVGSLTTSQTLAEFGRPGILKKGPGAERILTKMGVPGGEYIAGPMQDVKVLERQGLDPALRELLIKFQEDMDTDTLPRVLLTSEAMPGEPYSGFDLRIKTALQKLSPYKLMVEAFLQKAYRAKLLYAHYSGVPIYGFGTARRERGKRYEIRPNDIDPEILYLNVVQESYAPTDKMQQANVAMILKRETSYSDEAVLEELGVADPQAMIRQRTKERFFEAYVAGREQKITLTASGEIQKAIEQGAQELAQQQLQAAQSQDQGGPSMAAESGMGRQTPLLGEGQNMEGVGGMNMSPGFGGTPPIQASRGATKEGATGMTRGGEVVSGR